MQFIAVEEIITAIDERRRSAVLQGAVLQRAVLQGAVLESEECDRMAFRGPRRVEPSGLGAHALDQAAAQESDDVDLVR